MITSAAHGSVAMVRRCFTDAGRCLTGSNACQKNNLSGVRSAAGFELSTIIPHRHVPTHLMGLLVAVPVWQGANELSTMMGHPQ